MPQHKFISSKEILARIIRNTGYKLPSVYQDDILEWIPEGISAMQVTRSMLKVTSGDIDCPGEILVKNYCTSLPCGFISMISIQDKDGFPIGEASNTERLRRVSSLEARPSVFEVNPFVHQTSDGTTTPPTTAPFINVVIQGGDIQQVPIAAKDLYYEIIGNKIQTSFEEGYIKITYWSQPVCNEGYPLMPDNESFKQALEWHVMKRLIGAGLEHKVFNYQYCEDMYEKYAARGMAEVSYPSTDDMARAFRTNIRLVPPIGYADQFFINRI